MKRKISGGWWVWFALVAASNVRLFFVNVSPFMIDGEWHIYANTAQRFLEWVATSVFGGLLWGLLPYLAITAWKKRRPSQKKAA
jgi:hypothetical protein